MTTHDKQDPGEDATAAAATTKFVKPAAASFKTNLNYATYSAKSFLLV
jgi:hypothetical protein